MKLSTSEKTILEQSYPTILQINKLSHLPKEELMMTVLGLKPAMSNSITLDIKLKQNIDKIRDYGKQIGLYLATSCFKYIMNSPLGIYKEIPLNDPRPGKIIFAFSKSEDKARKAVDYYHTIDDYKNSIKLAQLMGYPECCIKFGVYLSNNRRDSDNFGFKNPAVESLKRSQHFAWQLNVFSLSPLSHYPCSLTCEKSQEYIDKAFSCLDYIDKRAYSFYIKYLTQPASLFWTCVDRILLFGDFKKYELGTGEIKYNRIAPLINSNAFYQETDKNLIGSWEHTKNTLRKGNKLIVTDDCYRIYSNGNMILEIKKINKYIPVLVKPDILP
jgi:hypothetical protein